MQLLGPQLAFMAWVVVALWVSAGVAAVGALVCLGIGVFVGADDVTL